MAIFWAIGGDLWRRNYSHINIYWYPWLGAIFSIFGYLEVSFADNSFIVLRMSWKEPAPLSLHAQKVLCCMLIIHWAPLRGSLPLNNVLFVSYQKPCVWKLGWQWCYFWPSPPWPCICHKYWICGGNITNSRYAQEVARLTWISSNANNFSIYFIF